MRRSKLTTVIRIMNLNFLWDKGGEASICLNRGNLSCDQILKIVIQTSNGGVDRSKPPSHWQVLIINTCRPEYTVSKFWLGAPTCMILAASFKMLMEPGPIASDFSNLSEKSPYLSHYLWWILQLRNAPFGRYYWKCYWKCD